jgi:hypothetical protein
VIDGLGVRVTVALPVSFEVPDPVDDPGIFNDSTTAALIT